MILYGIGWTLFLLPNDITTGGVPGIASIVYFATGFPVQYTYFAINAVLLMVSLKVLGFRFSLKTIFGVFTLTFFLSVIQKLTANVTLLHDQPFMACVLGASFCGSGIGIAFSANGSTGGTDIIAAIVNKYKNISFAKMMMYIDFLIIACSYVLFHSVEKMIFGYVVMGVMSYTMDMLINGKRQSVQILVLSDKYEEIATHVNNDIRRGVTVIDGVTILDGMGWYSKQPKKVLMILAKRNESVKIFRLIKSIDPKAFISQSNVVGVYGEGFDKIKA